MLHAIIIFIAVLVAIMLTSEYYKRQMLDLKAKAFASDIQLRILREQHDILETLNKCLFQNKEELLLAANWGGIKKMRANRGAMQKKRGPGGGDIPFKKRKYAVLVKT